MHFNQEVKPLVSRTINLVFALCVWLSMSAVAICAQTQSRVRVAVLDFGESATGVRAAGKVREAFTLDKLAVDSGVVVIDRNLAIAAALGNGYQGSLNLTTESARDLGAAIGCDFFIIGDADTAKRSPSTGDDYYESYAAIFIVSARTGRLVSWRRPVERRDTPAEAEKALLKTLLSGEPIQYRVLILRAFEDEAAERSAAVESPPATIEVMSDDDNGKGDTRAPRPYRRVKPPYPEAAAQAEVEATVDVSVDIDARGEISRYEIARWAGYGLDQSVIDTVKQMHFFPAMREGVAIPMRVLLRYNFRRTTPDRAPVKTLKIPRPND
jgi:TonB family protein